MSWVGSKRVGSLQALTDVEPPFSGRGHALTWSTLVGGRWCWSSVLCQLDGNGRGGRSDGTLRDWSFGRWGVYAVRLGLGIWCGKRVQIRKGARSTMTRAVGSRRGGCRGGGSDSLGGRLGSRVRAGVTGGTSGAVVALLYLTRSKIMSRSGCRS